MEKTVIIALALIGTLTAGFFLMSGQKTQSTAELKSIYNQWKLNYNINVGAAEDDFRFGVFSANYAKIQQHNKLGKTYTLGLNAFTHLTTEEFGDTHLGLKTVRKSQNTVAVNASPSGKADYRNQMNPVKNQGHCGSCWAFSTVGAIEGLHSVKAGNLYNLAEQELVDCSSSYGNEGCDGGLMDQGFQYVIAKGGLASEKAYPYTAADGSCKKVSQRSGKISSFVDVTANSARALMVALDSQPVSVAIQANAFVFQGYTGGVLNDDSCGTQLNHGVVAVGYYAKSSEQTPYYIVRNSWGASWGEAGHIRLAITGDDEGMCGIQMAASYPTL